MIEVFAARERCIYEMKIALRNLLPYLWGLGRKETKKKRK